MAVILGQSLFIPIVLAPLAYLVGRKAGSKAGWFAFVVLAYSTIALLFATMQDSDYVEVYPWQPIGEFGLKLDGLSLPFAAIIYILSTVLAVYSIPYMKHKIKEDFHNHAEENEQAIKTKTGLYYALYLLYAAGMLGTVLATNLIQFYIFFELMLIPSFFLLAEFGYGDRVRISIMYFLWTHAGAVVLLGGILTIGFLTGSFDFASIATSTLPEGVRTWIAVAVSLGLFVKLAAAGLHVWLPYAHAEAPTPISALLSPAMIGIGGYAFIRILVFLVPTAYPTIAFWVSIWGLITMFYGAMMAFAQDDIKRVLAYSSVSQMGYIIFGMASAYYVGVGGSVFQYVSHGTGKALLFMSAGAIIMQTGGLRSISKLGGLASKLPITATCALIGFLVIVGVPPMNGFQSEWMIFFGSFAGALQSGSQEKLIITGLALTTTPLTAGYALWTMKRVFFGKLPANLSKAKDPPATVTVPLLFLATLSIILGLYPDLVVERLMPLLGGVMK